jgi:hypothetical protein
MLPVIGLCWHAELQGGFQLHEKQEYVGGGLEKLEYAVKRWRYCQS